MLPRLPRRLPLFPRRRLGKRQRALAPLFALFPKWLRLWELDALGEGPPRVLRVPGGLFLVPTRYALLLLYGTATAAPQGRVNAGKEGE